LVALPIIMGLVFLFSSLAPINELSATEDTNHFIEPVVLSLEHENVNTEELVKSITRKNNIIFIDTIPELKKTDKAEKEQYPILETMPAGRQKEVFTNVDEMPKFPDCDDHCDGDAECLKNELMKFIYSNIRYPKEAREQGIEGIVVVQFIVDEHGQVIHPEIVRDIGGGIAEEALYVVEMMNTLSHRWTPGYQYGKPVKVLFTLPIRFKLEGDERNGEQVIHEKDKVQIKDGFILEEGKRTVLNGTALDQVVVVGMGNKKQFRDRPENNASDHDKIFKVVHNMPLFAQCTDEEVATFKAESDAKGQCPITNCGNNKLLEFVYKNLKYPEKARQLGVEGMSVVQFVIEKDGSVTDGKVVRDIGGGTSKAVMDMLQLMTDTHKWIPGTHLGEARRVLFTLPVRFKLSDDSKINTTSPPESTPIPPPPPPAPPKNFGDKTYKVVDQMPRFPGCESMDGTNKEKEDCSKEKLLQFVYSNLKYPEEARKAEIQGLNVVQFVIEPDGSIHFAKMARNIGGGTDEATMRMMDKMMEMEEKWTPGVQDGKAVRVQYTLPVRFKLEDKVINDESPLIVIDGETIGRMNRTETLNNIDVNNIESISVFKDEKALEKYGAEGRFGVIEVTLKNESEVNFDSIKEEKNLDDRDPSNLISNSLPI